jgi:ubiquinone/menaquinone biosynthesis C-methylase UbiE
MPTQIDHAAKEPEIKTLSDLCLVRCCVCDVLDVTPIAVGEDFEYHTCPESFLAVRCNRCGLVFLNPRPSVSDLDVIYPATYHAYNFTAENFGLIHSVRRRLEARRLLEVCRGLPAGSRVLDVGCGDGFHLKLLKEFGPKDWTLEGVDASELAAERARDAGLQVHLGRLEDLRLDAESFDLILLIATIEHVENPCDLLEEARRLLKRGGRIAVVTDNVDTLDFRIWKARCWGGYHFPRHWNLFSKSSFSRLAQRCDLRVKKIETLVSPVNWVYSIRNFLVDHRAPEFLVRQFSLNAAASLAVFTLWDQIFTWFGKGALLRLTLAKD